MEGVEEVRVEMRGELLGLWLWLWRMWQRQRLCWPLASRRRAYPTRFAVLEWHRLWRISFWVGWCQVVWKGMGQGQVWVWVLRADHREAVD